MSFRESNSASIAIDLLNLILVSDGTYEVIIKFQQFGSSTNSDMASLASKKLLPIFHPKPAPAVIKAILYPIVQYSA